MKFSFEEFHIWYQFGLSLMCSQKVGVILIIKYTIMQDVDVLYSTYN